MSHEIEVVHIFGQGTELDGAAFKAAALTTLGVVFLEVLERGGNRIEGFFAALIDTVYTLA